MQEVWQFRVQGHLCGEFAEDLTIGIEPVHGAISRNVRFVGEPNRLRLVSGLRATASPVMWQLKTSARGSGLDAVKGAVDIGEDVMQVLDPDRDAQETVGDAETLAFFRRQTPVR